MPLIRMLSRKKEITGTDIMATNLKRCLTTFDIALLGIGHMMGSGIYVVSPTTARNVTGPAIILSYLIAGFASLLAALAYADFGVRYPRSGSAYSYIYYSIGEFWAFFVGWNVILENVLSTAACARSCSEYIDALTGRSIFNFTATHIVQFDNNNFWSETPDILAFVILMSFVVFMTFGVKATSNLNNILVCVNMVILTIVIGVGVYFADLSNWTYKEGNANFVKDDHPEFINGFLPYGWNGVFKASASCFFAYVGFDAIAAAGEEALNPQKSLPVATLASMIIVTVVYVLVSGVMTLMVYFADISPTSGLPEALAHHGAYWAQYIVSVGAIAGMSTVIMATIFAMARVCYAMAEDGLVYQIFSKILPRSQIPVVSMYFFSLIAALAAAMLNIETLIEMLSIGTLMAYLLVACALLVSKYTPMDQAIDLQLESSTADYPKITDSPKLTQVIPTSKYEVQREKSFYGHILKKQFRCLEKVLPYGYSQRKLVIVVLFLTFFATLTACSALNLLGYVTGHWRQAEYVIWTYVGVCIVIVIMNVGLLFAHEIPGNKNSSSNQYNMPLVPFLPMLSVVINTALMATLQYVTWIRLVVWVILGYGIYFSYGIRNSKLSKR